MPNHDHLARRPTIADIARHAGVSTAAVSYTLNDRPGVSPGVRRRIRAAVETVGWVPRPAARAVRGRGAGAIGFAMAGPTRLFGIEPFNLTLASGLAGVLSGSSYELFLREVADVEQEAALYRRWWAEGRVDAVFLSNLRDDDPRIDVLTEIGMPAVVYGDPAVVGDLTPFGDGQLPAMADAIGYLATIGHGTVAFVTGPPQLRHTAHRTQAFLRACRANGIERSTVVAGHYRGPYAARITERLLTARSRPTAVIYDNDVMALAGMAATRALGLRVPADVSLISWEDSLLVRNSHPSMATVSRGVADRGRRIAQMLVALLAGEAVTGGPLEPSWLEPAGSVASPGGRSRNRNR
ncbi:LacI family DNA-binding transcriptional regulator [Virgisporangium ochraceum]